MGPALLPGEEQHRRRRAFDANDDGARTGAVDALVAAAHRRPGRRGEAPEQRARCAARRHLERLQK